MPIPSFAALLLIGFLSVSFAHAAETYWQTVAARVATKIDSVHERFRAGDGRAARQALTEAYFAEFEDSKMEAAIRKELGIDRARQLEGAFGTLRKAVKSNDGGAVNRLAAELKAALASDGKRLDAAGVPPEVFAVNQ